ncbi:hypothetical protein [Neomoorella mulderi]|uniref:Uncharacterized protein n=1 Tax=Moorella mulderi DSM 14980 TaxID=1122241 RepID=A0A151AX78_9FIRM|nr:hypothetical protein [Moorella mulderi]KYH32264.1 hypothetical protein MOMUL_14850 [Moorella mulderi DSM 14980]
MGELIEKQIERYETLLREMWTASAKYLGTFSANLLVERVVWEVSQEYREMELLQYNEEGISCAGISASLKKNPDLPANDMFAKFILRYLEILARLLGHEKTEKIAKKLDEEFPGFLLTARGNERWIN